MKAITFVLHTQQPILATSFQGDPNSDVSYSYLPGSMMRGALISRYLKRNRLQDSDILQNETIRRLFFDGTTRYLNAYLFTGEQRSLPVPLSWSRLKTEEVPCFVHDLSQADPEEIENISFKSISQRFCTVYDDQAVLHSENRRINIHNLRNRQRGRSIEGSGEIFRYDAIDARQSFQAVIVCEDADVPLLENLLDPRDLWLGGSQSAGYGHTQIQAVKVCDRWNEVGIQPSDRINRQKLSVTLLSDLILRDRWGQTVADPQILTGLLESKLQTSLKLDRSFIRSTLVGGFNRKWGLPLPQVQAISAGSVFIYEPIELSTQKIEWLEEQSLGDRTVEGFGRIAINWLVEHERFSGTLPPEKLSSKSIQLSNSSRQIANAMAERLLRQKLEQLIRDQVGRFELVTKAITNSQLSRLMLLARQELQSEGESGKVQALLDKSNLPSIARGQYEKTIVKHSNKSLHQQVLDWLNHPKSWITNLPSVTIANETLELSDKLAKEYTLRLIIAVAKKISKEGDE